MEANARWFSLTHQVSITRICLKPEFLRKSLAGLPNRKYITLLSSNLQMSSRYKKGTSPSKIVYLIPIPDNRMGRVTRGLDMLERICGSDALRNVVFITTNWEHDPSSYGEMKERVLRDHFLGNMIDAGARLSRFSASDSRESVWDAIGPLSYADAKPLLLQVEMGRDKLPLRETSASALFFYDQMMCNRLRSKD